MDFLQTLPHLPAFDGLVVHPQQDQAGLFLNCRLGQLFEHYQGDLFDSIRLGAYCISGGDVDNLKVNLHPVMAEVPPLEIGKKSVSTPLPVSNEDEQIQSEIDGLNDKFEALMYEYKTSNRSEIRK